MVQAHTLPFDCEPTNEMGDNPTKEKKKKKKEFNVALGGAPICFRQGAPLQPARVSTPNQTPVVCSSIARAIGF